MGFHPSSLLMQFHSLGAYPEINDVFVRNGLLMMCRHWSLDWSCSNDSLRRCTHKEIQELNLGHQLTHLVLNCYNTENKEVFHDKVGKRTHICSNSEGKEGVCHGEGMEEGEKDVSLLSLLHLRTS